jgi:hypothetical protein
VSGTNPSDDAIEQVAVKGLARQLVLEAPTVDIGDPVERRGDPDPLASPRF